MDYNEAVPSCGYPTTVTFHWKEHGHHLVTGLLDLFRRGTHVDTDVNFDGHLQVKVHRLVLSVFLPCVDNSIDPVLDLKDVADGSDDVRALVEFIYTGRLTVSVDRVQALRRLAVALQFHELVKAIDGLTTPVVSMDTGIPIEEELIESPSVHPNEFTMPGSGGDPLDNLLCTIKEEEPDTAAFVCNENYEDDDQEASIRCPLCPSRFVIQETFEQHFMLVHPIEGDRGAFYTQQPQDSIDDNGDSSKPFECRAIKLETSEDGGRRLSRRARTRYRTSKEEMRTNAQVVHGRSDLFFKCPMCSLQFQRGALLETHMRRVHQLQQQQLQQQQQHTFVDRPSRLSFRCLLCSFKWQRKSVLRRHFSMTHPRKRLFECSQCDTFVASNRDHVFRHEAEAHTRADGVTRGSRNNRKGHFPCDQCSKAFTRNSSLGRHVASVHDSQKPHRCLECFASFARKYRLMEHVKMKHPDMDNS